MKEGKSFDLWLPKKESLDSVKNNQLFFKEREVWWCAIGCNVGYEEDGKGKDFSRPVLVFKKFNRYIFWGIPFSTAEKISLYYVPVGNIYGKPNTALVTQIRLFDSRRLLDKLTIVSEETYLEIQKTMDTLIHRPLV